MIKTNQVNNLQMIDLAMSFYSNRGTFSTDSLPIRK
jgi:hypothetical protein